MPAVLIDAGPLVALFSPTDRHRARYEAFLADHGREGSLRLATTWPCIVEAAYLLAAPQRFELLAWIAAGGVIVYPFDAKHLEEMLQWMRRYTEAGKSEMDLADASLYWLAVDTGINIVLSVDRKDFERYRLPDGRHFTVI